MQLQRGRGAENRLLLVLRAFSWEPQPEIAVGPAGLLRYKLKVRYIGELRVVPRKLLPSPCWDGSLFLYRSAGCI